MRIEGWKSREDMVIFIEGRIVFKALNEKYRQYTKVKKFSSLRSVNEKDQMHVTFSGFRIYTSLQNYQENLTCFIPFLILWFLQLHPSPAMFPEA